MKSLLKEGCEIRAYDPAASERAREVLPGSSVSYHDSAYAAAQGADALLILTDWSGFAESRSRAATLHARISIVVDGRNLYDPATMSHTDSFTTVLGVPTRSRRGREKNQKRWSPLVPGRWSNRCAF